MSSQPGNPTGEQYSTMDELHPCDFTCEIVSAPKPKELHASTYSIIENFSGPTDPPTQENET